MTNQRKLAPDPAATTQKATRATPDRLIVGESRTVEEAEAFLAQVNAEHDGSVTVTGISDKMRAFLVQMSTAPANVVAYRLLPYGGVELTRPDGSIVCVQPDQED